MKKSLLMIISIALCLAWVALGAFIITFEEYEAFKLVSIVFLTGITFLLAQNLRVFTGVQQKNIFKSRIYFSIKVVLVCFIFALLHYINTYQFWSWDFTVQKLYQVREASFKLTKSLIKQHDLTLTFWGTRDQWNQSEELLNSYRQVSSRVKLQWIDPDKKPALAKTVEGRTLPLLHLEYGDQKKWVETIDEWVISMALNSLKEKKNTSVCFLSTHQTLSLLDESDIGLSSLKGLLQSEGYRIHTVELNAEEKLQECHILTIIGAKDDFLPAELDQLSALTQKMPLLIALGPSQDTSKIKHLKDWLAQLHVKTSGTPVLDQSVLQFGEEAINVLWEAHYHQQTNEWSSLKNIQGRVLWQLTTAFEISDHVSPIIWSQAFPKTWQEASWKEVLSGKVTFNDKEDKKGPLPLMVEVISSSHQPIVVVGTDRLWMNGFKNYPANMNLFLVTVKKLLKENMEESVTPVMLRDEKLYLYSSQANLIFYLSIIVMPSLMLLLAYWVFRKNSLVTQG